MQPIVLTFDDGFLAQYDIARPALLERGLTATFFICGSFIEHPYLTDTFMRWEQVQDLERSGFEIGSHLYNHFAMIDVNVNHTENIKKLEQRLHHYGISRPVSLSYPGYHVDANAIKIVKSFKYRFARAGCERTSEFITFQEGGSGPHYNYLYDNPYNINCSGIFGQKFGYKEFVRTLQDIKPNEIPVYCFHSFTGLGIKEAPQTDISIDTFIKCLDYIVDNNFQTVRMCHIEKFI